MLEPEGPPGRARELPALRGASQCQPDSVKPLAGCEGLRLLHLHLLAGRDAGDRVPGGPRAGRGQDQHVRRPGLDRRRREHFAAALRVADIRFNSSPTQGRTIILHIADRRWMWAHGEISGNWNQVDPYPDLDPSRRGSTSSRAARTPGTYRTADKLMNDRARP